MSLNYVKFSPGFEAFMPKEYRDMVEHGPFGKKTTVSQMGSFKEILEEHPMCAGCAMTLFIRLAIVALPNPEDTITVGTAGCGRLAISQAAIPFVYGNYGDQNGVASGLSRGLRIRFGDQPKDVVVMAGDGGTADIGFQQVLHSWFRKERFTTIMLDNEVYGNTGGQESGMTTRGAVLKMAPLGKKFEKMDMVAMAKIAGCAMTLFIRLAIVAFPNPEDTITVGTAGCGRLAISQAAIPFVYGNYGDQNGVASGLSRGLRIRFGDQPKDVVVMAGDGGTADIGFQQVLHSWFRKERFTTIMLDNEVYGNTGGQESGMTTRGAVLKMAPLGKKFEKMDMVAMAKIAGCAYIATVVPNNPRRVESCIKKAVLIAREVGPTYIQAYTSCNIEYAIPTDQVMADAKAVEDDRYKFAEYVSDEAKEYLTARYGYKEFVQKPAAAVTHA